MAFAKQLASNFIDVYSDNHDDVAQKIINRIGEKQSIILFFQTIKPEVITILKEKNYDAESSIEMFIDGTYTKLAVTNLIVQYSNLKQRLLEQSYLSRCMALPEPLNEKVVEWLKLDGVDYVKITTCFFDKPAIELKWW